MLTKWRGVRRGKVLAEANHEETIVFAQIGMLAASSRYQCSVLMEAHADRSQGVRGGAGGDPSDDTEAVRCVPGREQWAVIGLWAVRVQHREVQGMSVDCERPWLGAMRLMVFRCVLVRVAPTCFRIER